jgi:hypothetical protein
MSNKPGKASQKKKNSLLGRKKQYGLNDPKCSHWKPTNHVPTLQTALPWQF